MMRLEGMYCSGTLNLTLDLYEPRSGHDVFVPKITDLRTGTVLLDLDGLWDLLSVSEHDGLLELSLRKYPGGGRNVRLRLDPTDGQLYVEGKAVTQEQLANALDAHL